MTIVHLEAAVGRKVRDADGRVAGRLEEIHADWEGSECVITYYVIAAKGTYLLRALNIRKATRSFVVPWDRMDWRDPKHPRLTCRLSDLKSG